MPRDPREERLINGVWASGSANNFGFSIGIVETVVR